MEVEVVLVISDPSDLSKSDAIGVPQSSITLFPPALFADDFDRFYICCLKIGLDDFRKAFVPKCFDDAVALSGISNDVVYQCVILMFEGVRFTFIEIDNIWVKWFSDGIYKGLLYSINTAFRESCAVFF